MKVMLESASSSKAKPKNQPFSDATVRIVAKEFPVELATLAKLDDKQFDKAMARGHRQFGLAVRNIIRQTRDPIARNPVELDDIYPQVLRRAIDLGLYKEADFNADDLAALTGTKPKPMDLRLFKTAEEYKAFIVRLKKMLDKVFGEGIEVERSSAKLNVKTKVKQNVGTQTYNSLRLLMPMHIKQMHLTDNDTYWPDRLGLVFSQSAVYITGLTGGMGNVPIKKASQEIKLVKGTSAEVLTLLEKHLKFKTNTIKRPVSVGVFDEAAEQFIEKFGRDVKAKGIEIIPGRGKAVIFFHPKRGSVTLRFEIDAKGRLLAKDKFKASFGETFNITKLVSKATWPKLLNSLLV